MEHLNSDMEQQLTGAGTMKERQSARAMQQGLQPKGDTETLDIVKSFFFQSHIL
jgi:hypothetical protein